VTRWRFNRWQDLVAAWATVTLGRLERPPGAEWRIARHLDGPRPAGAADLAAELEGLASGLVLAHVAGIEFAATVPEPVSI